MTPVQDYNTFQKVFAASMCSNAIDTFPETVPKLQATMDGWMPQGLKDNVGSDWEVVWGPVVYKFIGDKYTTADNTWMVVKGIAEFDQVQKTTYVVAIAGTTPRTLFAIDMEDIAIERVVDFENWTSKWTGGPGGVPTPKYEDKKDVKDSENQYIAYGTALGVHILMSVPPPPAPSTAKCPGQTLGEYLSTLSGDIKVVFTGHSLGGALAPTLALGIAQAKLITSTLPLMPNVQTRDILVYPTAGASPGNYKFNAAFTGSFPPQYGTTYDNWNLNLWNTVDIVPQAHCPYPDISPDQNLTRIPGMYGGIGPLSVRWFIKHLLIPRSIGSKITYMPLPGFSFTATDPFRMPDPSTWKEFLLFDAKQEHIQEYLSYVGLPPQLINPPAPPTSRVLSSKELEAVYAKRLPILGAEICAMAQEFDEANAQGDQFVD